MPIVETSVASSPQIVGFVKRRGHIFGMPGPIVSPQAAHKVKKEAKKGHKEFENRFYYVVFSSPPKVGEGFTASHTVEISLTHFAKSPTFGFFPMFLETTASEGNLKYEVEIEWARGILLVNNFTGESEESTLIKVKTPVINRETGEKETTFSNGFIGTGGKVGTGPSRAFLNAPLVPNEILTVRIKCVEEGEKTKPTRVAAGVELSEEWEEGGEEGEGTAVETSVKVLPPVTGIVPS